MHKPTQIEIEGKLIVPDASAFQRLPDVLRGLCSRCEDMGEEVVEDTYFDTDDWRLYTAGFACRVRHTRKGNQLTLKGFGKRSAQVTVRPEFHAELARPLQEQLALPEGPPALEKLRTIVAGQPLRELFHLRNRRRTLLADYGSLAAQVLCDDFVISAGAKTLHLAEIEIEVARGAASDLERLMLELRHAMELGTEKRSKFQQGLALAGLQPPDVHGWRKPDNE